MAKRIVIMAGGTGGHVFPALAVAEELRTRGWQVSWLGTQNGLEARVVPANNIEIDWLSVAGFRGKGIISKFTAIFKLAKACLEARAILRRRKPDVVLGMGGFVALPGGLMARWLGVPLVIHEQNRVPGTTNRLLVKRARKVLEAFPGSFPKKANAICTGNPLRQPFMNMADVETLQCNVSTERGQALRILVVGGSQGAKALNDVIPVALAQLADVEIKHQTGAAQRDEVAARYAELGAQAEVSAFIEDMPAVYAWADLVVCRAGAMTVSEVAAAGLPAIFIPLPSAIDDHQTANARYLTDDGAGILLPQKELTPEKLTAVIKEHRDQLNTMGLRAKSKARLDATKTIATIVTNLA